MQDPDAALVKSSQIGDPDAFGALVERHQDTVYRLALRMLGNPHDAADVVQESFIKAWRALPSFRGSAKFSTWLYRIAVRVATDRLRSSKPELLSDMAPADGIGPNEPAEAVLRSESKDELERALALLPAQYRVVLTLFYGEQCSHEEISSVLGIPVGTIKTHLHRARTRLKAAFDKLGWDRGNFR